MAGWGFSSSPNLMRWLWVPARAKTLGRDDGSLDPSSRALPIRIAQAALEDLAGILARQGFEDFDVLRYFVVGQHGFQLRADFSDVQRHSGLRFHHRQQRLAEFIVGNAEYGAVVDARSRMQRGLDFRR